MDPKGTVGVVFPVEVDPMKPRDITNKVGFDLLIKKNFLKLATAWPTPVVK